MNNVDPNKDLITDSAKYGGPLKVTKEGKVNFEEEQTQSGNMNPNYRQNREYGIYKNVSYKSSCFVAFYHENAPSSLADLVLLNVISDNVAEMINTIIPIEAARLLSCLSIVSLNSHVTRRSVEPAP